MLEPVNTVLKAVRRLELLRGDTVLVAGQGPIGLMFTKILQLQGIKVLATDLLPSRLKLARKFGAHRTCLAAEVSSHVTRHSSLLDSAIIAVPSDAAVTQALQLVRGAGKILLFAHTKRGAQAQVDLANICLDEKDLIGSYSSDFTLQREVARLVFSRQLDVRPLITHRFLLSETADAVALAAKPTEASLKIVVKVFGT
jgi:L-iditol 2-dehydrogenase